MTDRKTLDQLITDAAITTDLGDFDVDFTGGVLTFEDEHGFVVQYVVEGDTVSETGFGGRKTFRFSVSDANRRGLIFTGNDFIINSI